MRAELANLNHCAVPIFKPRRRQLELARLYIITSIISTKDYDRIFVNALIF